MNNRLLMLCGHPAWYYGRNFVESDGQSASDAIPADISHEGSAGAFACSQCDATFRSRNMLFKHLRTTCLPAVATLDVVKPPMPRLALTVCYVGHRLFGFKMNSANDEGVRPSVAGTVQAAAERAWGARAATVLTEAVRTEKGASACGNVLIMGLHRGCPPADADESRLRRELPDDILLIGPPREIAPSDTPFELFQLVKRQVQVCMIPYSALIRRDQLSAPPTCRQLWIGGLPDGCTPAEVDGLLEEAGCCPAASSPDGCARRAQVFLDSSSGSAEIDLCAAPANGTPSATSACEAVARAVEALDGRCWRGARLLAMCAIEAAQKHSVHCRIAQVRLQVAPGLGPRTPYPRPFIKPRPARPLPRSRC